MSHSALQIIGRRVFLLLESEHYNERDITLTDIRIRDLNFGPISSLLLFLCKWPSFRALRHLPNQGCACFPEILKKFSERRDFVEFVLGSFSCFNIGIANSNFTFCGA